MLEFSAERLIVLSTSTKCLDRNSSSAFAQRESNGSSRAHRSFLPFVRSNKLYTYNISSFSRADSECEIGDIDKLVRWDELREKARATNVSPVIRAFSRSASSTPWHRREFRPLFAYICHLELVCDSFRLPEKSQRKNMKRKFRVNFDMPSKLGCVSQRFRRSLEKYHLHRLAKFRESKTCIFACIVIRRDACHGSALD